MCFIRGLIQYESDEVRELILLNRQKITDSCIMLVYQIKIEYFRGWYMYNKAENLSIWKQ